MFVVSKECLPQIIAVIPVFLNEIVLGLGIGWVAPTLRRLQDDESYAGFSVTNDQASWIASLHELSRFLVPLVSNPLLDVIGRKGVLICATVSFLISNTLIAFTESVVVIFLARILFGIAAGLYVPAGILYLCENFQPTYRGVFGATLVACYYGGSLVEFILVNYLSYKATAYTNTVITLLTLSTIYFSVETPEYLLSKCRTERAQKNFLHLRGTNMTNTVLTEEFEGMRQRVQKENEEKRSMWTYFATPVYRKTIGMVIVFSFLASATGSDPVTSYVSISFVEGVFTPNQYTILYGALQFVAILCGTVIFELVNRRAFLTFSLLVCVFSHLVTATLFYLQKHAINVPYFSWWIFAAISIYSMAFSSCVLPNYCLVPGELLQRNVRPFGSGLAVAAYSLVGFLLTKGFFLVDETVGVCWNFVFYAVTSFGFVFFVRLVLPETRGKSLTEIQAEIESGNDDK